MKLNTAVLRRAAAATLITASAASFVPMGTTSAVAAPAIVEHARSHIGEWGGQCKAFVQRMYNETHANNLGTGYYQAYIDAGYHRVNKADVVPGDIIQETDASHTRGIHTAIVTGDPAGATIRVVDSNWVGYEIVGEHAYDPTTHAANNGGAAYYWHK